MYKPDHARCALGWASLVLLALLGLGGAARGPDGLLLGMPGAMALALLLAAGILLAIARPGRGPAGVVGGLAVVPLLLLSGIHLPGVYALSGPPLLSLALAGIVILMALARPRWEAAAFFPVILLLYLAAAARAQAQVGPQGDEPHYLMVADSLLRDRDLSLERDYAEGRHRRFFPSELQPHYRVRGKGGEIYSLHALGLSLLVLPFYGVAGYPGASFFMAFIAALLAREIRELVRSWNGSEPLAAAVAWCLALSPPLIHYAGLIFTEVPAAWVIATALRRGQRPLPSALGMLGLGTAIALLPWLNVRYVPLAVVLLAYVLTGRPGRRSAIALVLPGLLSAGLIALYHWALYGFFDPRRVYGRRPEFSLGLVPQGLPGLLLDQEFGLLVYAPLFALALPGLILLFRAGRRQALAALALVGVTVLIAATWPMWRGGWNPPARFLVPAVPVLAVAVATILGRGLHGGAALLIGWSLWTGLAGAAEPRLVHRDRDGTAPFFRVYSGAEEWTRLLPGYVLPESEPRRQQLALLWAGTLALACIPRRRPTVLALRLSAATLALIAAAGLASSIAESRTGGRDAVRIIGRPALSVPEWRWTSRAAAVWGPREIEWGPLYEPHRHPQGAVLGSRLPLPDGTYRLMLEGEEPQPMSALPALDLDLEGPRSSRRSAPFARVPRGLAADFQIFPGERAVTLLLRGGGPMLLENVRLEGSTFSRDGGLIR